MRRIQLLVLLVVPLCGCGVSTLEMSDADRGGLTARAAASNPVNGGALAAQDSGVPLDPGVDPTPDAGVPAECEDGSPRTCVTSCGSDGREDCVQGTWGACHPPPERCDNGVDDDCDSRVDHGDPDCTPVVHTCESEEGGGCNGDQGYGDRCTAADNENGCSASRFNAWCNRRNPALPDIWHDWVHDWVSTRCDGAIDQTNTQYSTWYCRDSSNDEYRCTTPLVLSFDGAPVRFEPSSQPFAFTPGNPVQSDWPAAATPWLARDLDGNGRIDDGSELFGSDTKLPRGPARHGFEALAALDANRDGTLDARDPSFRTLLVWRDENRDRVAQPGELTTLAQARIDALALGFSTEPRCDLRGNCERERSGFTWRAADGTAHQGALVDVYLRVSSRPLACR